MKKLYEINVGDKIMSTHAHSYEEALRNIDYRIKMKKEEAMQTHNDMKQMEFERELLLFILKKLNGLEKYRVEATLERILEELKE